MVEKIECFRGHIGPSDDFEWTYDRLFNATKHRDTIYRVW